jgi:DNA replication factor GINS
LDEFFQRLREIQKKERSLSGLSPVGDDFYQKVFRYLDGLMEKIGNNQLSLDSYLLLRDAQRIVAEICERREHKITNSAVMNVQRSYQLFVEQKDEVTPQSPLNSTPEETDLYKELFRSLSQHRKAMDFPISSSSVKNKKKKERRTGHDHDDKVNPEALEQSLPLEKLSTGLAPELDDNSLFPPVDDEIYRQFGQEPDRTTSKAVKRSIKSENRVKNSKVPQGSSASEFSDTTKMPTEVLMITAELPSIMGIDNKVYGPMYPGDVITMPEANARILVKRDKGRPIQRYK